MLRLALGAPLSQLGEHGRCLALLGEAEALARVLDDRARLGQVLARMAQVRRVTGDLDGAMAAGQQALELAAALGDSALQVQASYYLGQVYHAIGDFGRAAELLRWNVEAADRESGTPRTDWRIQSRAWLARTLSALGAFAEGRRHGEEALRLATLEGRGTTPIIAHGCLGHLYLAQGDLEHAIRVLEQGLALCRASGNRPWLRVTAAGLGYAYALQGRLAEGHALLEEAISEGIRTGALLSHASPGCMAQRGLSSGGTRRGGLAARPPGARPGPAAEGSVRTRRSRCTSLASSRPTPIPPMPRRPKPTTSRPSPWPRNSACARSRPTATAASARCMPRPASRSRPALSCPPPSSCTGDMEMTFWLPQTEAALAQVEGR